MGEREKLNEAFVLLRNLHKVKRKSKTTSHLSRGIAVKGNLWKSFGALLCQPLSVSAIRSLFDVMETLYNINRNESDENIAPITGKQIFIVVVMNTDTK